MINYQTKKIKQSTNNKIEKNKNTNTNNKYEINNYINNGKRSVSCIRNNNMFSNKSKNMKSKVENKKLNTFIYCYDESNEGNSISNNNNYNHVSKISSKINISNQKKVKIQKSKI